MNKENAPQRRMPVGLASAELYLRGGVLVVSYNPSISLHSSNVHLVKGESRQKMRCAKVVEGMTQDEQIDARGKCSGIPDCCILFFKWSQTEAGEGFHDRWVANVIEKRPELYGGGYVLCPVCMSKPEPPAIYQCQDCTRPPQ